MNCMKCGKEIPEGMVFCQECLDGMAKYPVAHDAHIQLPRRPAKTQEKKPKEIPLTVQIARLRRAIRWLLGVIGVLVILIAILTLLLMHNAQLADTAPVIGKNYTTAPKTPG